MFDIDWTNVGCGYHHGEKFGQAELLRVAHLESDSEHSDFSGSRRHETPLFHDNPLVALHSAVDLVAVWVGERTFEIIDELLRSRQIHRGLHFVEIDRSRIHSQSQWH